MAVVMTFKGGQTVGDSRTFPDDRNIVVGRSPQADLPVLDDPLIESEHFVLERTDAGRQVRDLGTGSGTFVNGKRVQAARVEDGDIVRAGLTTMQLHFTHQHVADLPTSVLPRDEPARSEAGARGGAEASAAPQELVDGIEEAGYILGEQIGQGKFGIVYKAVRQADNATVAIKVLKAAAEMPSLWLRFFVREMDVMRALEQPNIVRLLHVGSAGEEFAWFAMEYVSGQDLGRLVRSAGNRLRPADACTLTLQLLDALQYAHTFPPPEGPFVHRDIKPGNVLVSGSPGRYQAKLADFGLAKNFEQAGYSGMTVTGQVRGTLYFMSPQQLKDTKYAGPEVDLFGAGCVLYFCLTGRLVYDLTGEESDLQASQTILANRIVPVRKRMPDVPAELAVVIDRAVHADPQRRFHTAHQMKLALERAFPSPEEAGT